MLCESVCMHVYMCNDVGDADDDDDDDYDGGS